MNTPLCRRLSRFMRLAAAVSAIQCALFADNEPALAQGHAKTVIGRVEKVWLGGANIVLRAKIDSGARTTTLGTEGIETFKRRDQDWVRFRFLNEAGAPVTLTRKVVRFAKLKKKNAPGTEVRPVVLLRLCVADIYSMTQVNLVGRADFNYPVLIGRRFLFGRALVNVAEQYTSEPRCAEMKSDG